MTNEVDTAALQGRIRDLKLTQRALADHLGADAATVSMLLRGKRRITPAEAKQIAGFLKLPIGEVLRLFGVDVSEDPKVPIIGHCTTEGLVTLLAPGAQDRAAGPADLPRDARAIQVRAPFAPGDGWILFCEGTQSDPSENLGRLCLAATATGELTIGVIARGYQSGRFNITTRFFTLGAPLENLSLVWASRVFWIRPS
jgi:transcriptional regulator with XRE-family HTH domain